MNTNRFASLGNISGGVKFLLSMLLLYGIIGLFDPTFLVGALLYFREMLIKVLPILGIVFVILFAINLFLKADKVSRYLGREAGVMGWLYAVIGGILISGPPYVLYPMLGEMKKHGARSGLIVTLLYNRNVKVQFLPALVYYFGLRYAIVLSIYIILFSVLNGMVFEILVSDRPPH